jgi:hypothetical protein
LGGEVGGGVMKIIIKSNLKKTNEIIYELSFFEQFLDDLVYFFNRIIFSKSLFSKW